MELVQLLVQKPSLQDDLNSIATEDSKKLLRIRTWAAAIAKFGPANAYLRERISKDSEKDFENIVAIIGGLATTLSSEKKVALVKTEEAASRFREMCDFALMNYGTI